MKKKHGILWWRGKAWDAFSIFIRLRDSIGQPIVGPRIGRCCTCGKLYPAFGKGCMQAGHYVPGRSNAVLFEEHNTHAQCYNCNVNLKGNPIKYRKFIERKYGIPERDRLEALQDKRLMFDVEDYAEIKARYEKMVAAMGITI